MYLRIKGKEKNVFSITKAEKMFKGRGATTIQVEGKCIIDNTKLITSFGNADKVELVTVNKKPKVYELLYIEGSSCMVMDPETFEQIEVFHYIYIYIPIFSLQHPLYN